MAHGNLQLSVIGQIAVPATDLERAVAFYRDTLGIKYLFQVPNLAFFDCAGVRLMLDPAEDGSGERGSPVIYPWCRKTSFFRAGI